MRTAWKPSYAGTALTVLLTAIVYLPAMRGGFVFDDATLVTGNRIVHTGD